jgi:Sortilin, neurotensin receptor 3,
VLPEVRARRLRRVTIAAIATGSALAAAGLSIVTVRAHGSTPAPGVVAAASCARTVSSVAPEAPADPPVSMPGPDGGWVAALAVDPTSDALYAATFVGGGVWRSTDGAATWRPADTGLTDLDVRDVAVDPVDGSVFLGTQTAGVFRSTDGGKSWHSDGRGEPPPSAFALAVSPDGETVFAGSRGDGVFRWTSGAGWNAASSGLPGLDVTALAIDPVAPETVLAGVHGYGVYRSTDAGSTWLPLGAGTLGTVNVRALAIDPTDSRTIYAGAYGGGVFVSHDEGATWNAQDRGLSNRFVRGLAIDPADHRRVFAATYGDGVFVSGDGGRSWTPSSDGLAAMRVRDVAFDASDPHTVYAGLGSDGGVAVSHDGGSSWASAERGMTNTDVHALGAPKDGGVVYAGTWNRGVSSTTGDSWKTLGGGLGAYDSVVALAEDPHDAHHVYAATSDGRVLQRSGGADWTALPDPPGSAVHALVPSGDGSLLAATDSGLVKTTPDDAGWRTPSGPAGPVCSLTTAPDGSMYAAGVRQVYVRGPDSTTWRSLGAPPSPPVAGGLLATGTVLLAGTEHGAFAYDHGSKTWSAVEGLDASIVAAAGDAGEVRYAALGTGDGRVFLTRNGGESWVQLKDYVTAGRPIRSIAVTRLHGGLVVAVGTRGAGVVEIPFT